MDFDLELKEQTAELLKYYRDVLPIGYDTIEIEHEETPLEVCYLDQWGFSTGVVENLVRDVAIGRIDSIECADQIIGSLFAFPLVDVID